MSISQPSRKRPRQATQFDVWITLNNAQQNAAMYWITSTNTWTAQLLSHIDAYKHTHKVQLLMTAVIATNMHFSILIC